MINIKNLQDAETFKREFDKLCSESNFPRFGYEEARKAADDMKREEKGHV